MKEKVMKKVNNFGKVGIVVGHICRGVSILAALAIVLFAIGTCFISENLGEMQYYNGVKWSLNLSEFSEEDKQEIVPSILGSVDAGEAEDIVLQNKEVKTTAGDITIKFKEEEMEIVSAEYDENTDILLVDTRTNDINILQPVKVLVLAICVVLSAVAEIITFTFVIKLCKEFKTCETPFTQNIVDHMKKVAYSLIPWCITYPLMEAAFEMMVSNTFAFTLNLGLIFVVFVIVSLTYMFRYGVMLQQESDETL